MKLSKAQLEQYASNPNVRKFLDLIAKSEGVAHGYNTLLGNDTFSDFSKHPGVRKQFTQTDKTTNTSDAAGRYQFLGSTWRGLQKNYGLSDFSPANQDLGAIALIAEKGQLNNVVNGNYRDAVKNLGSTWVSFPSGNAKQNKHSWETIDKMWSGATTQAPAQGVSTANLDGLGQIDNPFSTLAKTVPTITDESFKPLTNNVQDDGVGSTVLKGPLGLTQASNKTEQTIFDDIVKLNLDADKEAAYVTATDTVSKALNLLQGGDLLSVNPLGSYVSTIFSKV